VTTTPNGRRGPRALLAVLAGVLALALVGTALWAMANRRYLEDAYTGWNYEASAELAAVRDRAAMSDEGLFLFAASTPSLEDAEQFNESCGREDPTFYVLGCYAGTTIHLYRITDERLDGIVEVTAAHEMLHAAWDRMTETEHDELEPLLEAEYERVADDAFAERMDYYAEAQPGTRVNELHSIIGTEVADLSPELEAHYDQYFEDRSIVVGLHDGYSSVLADIQERSESLVAELDALAGTIEAGRSAYEAGTTELNDDIEVFNARASTPGGFDTDEFERQRDRLYDRGEELDEQRDAVNADVSRYEELRAELESLNAESAALLQSMDSLQAPKEVPVP